MDDTSKKGLIGNVIGWFQHPFNAEGDAVNWVLFIGLLVIAAWFWHTVLLAVKAD